MERGRRHAQLRKKARCGFLQPTSASAADTPPPGDLPPPAASAAATLPLGGISPARSPPTTIAPPAEKILRHMELKLYEERADAREEEDKDEKDAAAMKKNKELNEERADAREEEEKNDAAMEEEEKNVDAREEEGEKDGAAKELCMIEELFGMEFIFKEDDARKEEDEAAARKEKEDDAAARKKREAEIAAILKRMNEEDRLRELREEMRKDKEDYDLKKNWCCGA